MVLYPYREPRPVMRPPFRRAAPPINRRAETLRPPSPSFQEDQIPQPDTRNRGMNPHYRTSNTPGPQGRQRRGSRKSPSRRPHRRVPYFYPPSPQYRPHTSEQEEELTRHTPPRRQGKITDPTPTPSPRVGLLMMMYQHLWRTK